jgi:carboxyl-terminal processing protease
VRKSSSLLSSILIIVFLFSNVFSQNQTASQINSKTSSSVKTATETKKVVTTEIIEKDVAEALTVIQDNYVVNGKKLDYNELFKSSIESMLHTLDPHSNYFDAKETEEFRTDQSSQYFGIGATIGTLSDEKEKVVGTFIKATFENSPAHRAGLLYGDKIIEINGVSMIGKASNEVSSALRGPRGTSAKIVIERYSTGKREKVEIIRDAIPQPSIASAYMIRPGIGYMAMTGGFNQTTFNEFRRAMQDLKAQGMQQLVIDLRNNGGGLVSQSLNIANTFLAQGQTILTQKGRVEGASDSFQANNSKPDTTPLVVLVNRNSASASEILAGALQDHDRALIVGENTYGKGLVQQPFMLDYGSMLLLTIAKYETPSGRLIQRDYSSGNLYDYYTKGGSFNTDNEAPKGAESKTDSGRIVYSGGGINPDEVIKPKTISTEKARQQAKLIDPVFAFVLDLSTGKIAGFDTYRINRPISFDYTLKSADFAVTDNLFQTFKKFAMDKYKVSAAQIDREREFLERILRAELVIAAYGSTTTSQVYNEADNQLMRAIELLPQAKKLALEGEKANAAKKTSSIINR